MPVCTRILQIPKPNSTAKPTDISPTLITAWLQPKGMYTSSLGYCVNSSILLDSSLLSFNLLYYKPYLFLHIAKNTAAYKNHFFAPEDIQLYKDT